jgi:predicted transcriptional regulator
MTLPKNGVAKEIRHYVGSLFIFLLIMTIIFILMKYPVLETNKEVVMMLIGTLSASIGLVISTITGSKPDDINALKTEIEKKNDQIESLVAAKDHLEAMIINLQKQILENQDDVMDKIILKAALDYDDRAAALKQLNKNGSKED